VEARRVQLVAALKVAYVDLVRVDRTKDLLDRTKAVLEQARAGAEATDDQAAERPAWWQPGRRGSLVGAAPADVER